MCVHSFLQAGKTLNIDLKKLKKMCEKNNVEVIEVNKRYYLTDTQINLLRRNKMVAPTNEEIRKHLDRERQEIIASQHDYDFDFMFQPEAPLKPEIKEAYGQVQVGHEDDDGFVYSYEAIIYFKDFSLAKLKTKSAFFDNYDDAQSWVFDALDDFCVIE